MPQAGLLRHQMRHLLPTHYGKRCGVRVDNNDMSSSILKQLLDDMKPRHYFTGADLQDMDPGCQPAAR